ncbi:MAG: glutamyl-tRNA reductase [Gaiellaceae bacterium]
MRLALVGISHHSAPIDLRERVALDPAGAARLAERLARGAREVVCLSTCNRTELYLADEEVIEAEADAIEALAELAGAPHRELAPSLYRRRDQEAALHLFRVAAGLDSLVPGEGEILGQVRQAYEAGAARGFLDKVFREALHVGKRVRSETAIGESPASVPSAAAALAQQVFGELEGRSALVVGAGKMGTLAARSLVARGARVIYVASRGGERAQELAAQLGGRTIAIGELGDSLAEVDIVVSSTSADRFVIGKAEVTAALRRRSGRPLFLIDLAVPRDVEPAVNALEGCYLYNVDDLQAVVSETMSGRHEEAVRAEQLVREEAERFRDWQASLEVVPAIASLRAWAEDVRLSELQRAESKLGRLSAEERKTVESLTAQIVNKLLHRPTVRLKQAATAPDGVVYADTVRHLFGLGEDDR